MSYRTGPKIVTDGLVLCLDAADRNSYPGTGSTWGDLSGNGNNGTFGALTAAPTFSSSNGGCIVFDGDNDYIDCGNVSFSSNAFSLEVIFKWDDYNTSNISFLVAGNNEALEIHTRSPNGLRFIPYDYPDNGFLDVNNIIDPGINHVIFTANQSTTSKAYKDGQLFGTSSTTSSLTLSSSQSVTIGRRTSGIYYFDGNVYLVRIYNKVLSPYEALQNYEATKGRFGL